MSTTVKAEATITLTFGESKIELSMADARKLLAELQELVGPKISLPVLPRVEPKKDRDIPFPWDRYPSPLVPPRRPHWSEPMCYRGKYATQEYITLP